MPTEALLPWLIGALVLALLIVAGRILYQALSYRRLRRCCSRLCEIKLGQRQVYRRLEGLRQRWDALSVRVPCSARPAPFTELDERAIVTDREVRAALEAVKQGLHPITVDPLPRLSLWALLRGRYRAELAAAAGELAAAETLLQQVARAEALTRELEAVLAETARKPLEVQRRLADLQALAEALAQEVEREQKRGTEGLVPLQYEAQAVRAAAMTWVERLRTARPPDAGPLAIEAEALRPQLLARLAQAQTGLERVAGMHTQALGGQERLAEALAGAEAMAAGLRPLLSSAVRPSLEALHRQVYALAARYREHDAAAYEHVGQRSWRLLAEVRGLTQRIERLSETDSRVGQATGECNQALAELRAQVQAERQRGQVRLDVTGAALKRAEQAVVQLNALWPGSADHKQPLDEAGVATHLGNAEAQAQRAREEIRAAREALAAWRGCHRRVQEARGRLEAAEAEHQRFAQAWQELQGFRHDNWAQVDPGWFEDYCAWRAAIMSDAAAVWARYGRGDLDEPAMAEMAAVCDGLVQRWQALAHQGQWMAAALAGAQAVQRQVLEGLSALHPELQQMALVAEELPADSLAAPVRRLVEETLGRYRALEAAAQRPAEADFRRLRDEDLAHLREQMAACREALAGLVESERNELRRQMAALWQRWDPLSQRLARATPATDVDRQALARRCQALSRTTRAQAATLKQIMELQAVVSALTADVIKAAGDLERERTAVRAAEQQTALAREAAARRRANLLGLLKHPHPQVVDEEWERSSKAWSRGETIVRELEPRRGARHYVAKLGEAGAQYAEAGARARSALVRLLRYAFLEDPEGMREVCRRLDARWMNLGMTAREEHIGELLADLEKKGETGRLVEDVTIYLNARKSAR